MINELMRRRAMMFEKAGDLPSGYTQYDWVQADSSTGAPEIDTGISIGREVGWLFEGKFAKTGEVAKNSYAPQWIFSKYQTPGYNANFALGKYSIDANALAFNYNGRVNNETYSGHDTNNLIALIGEWHSFVLRETEGVTYGGELEFDGNVFAYTTSANANTSNLKLWLPNAQTSEPYPCRFARFKVSYNGALVADLIPAKRDADDVVGFYDIVRNAFYAPTTEGVTLLCGNGFENFNT